MVHTCGWTERSALRCGTAWERLHVSRSVDSGSGCFAICKFRVCILRAILPRRDTNARDPARDPARDHTRDRAPERAGRVWRPGGGLTSTAGAAPTAVRG
eukprot:3122641-Rhodomonas_salina.1